MKNFAIAATWYQYNTPANTPDEKVFAYHFIVQASVGDVTSYYDPSYGVTYPNGATSFEFQSVSGYAKKLTPDSVAGGDYHFAPMLGVEPNITFTVNPLNSM